MKYLPIKIFCLVLLTGLACFTFMGMREKKASGLKVYKDRQVCDFFKRETGWIAGDGAYSIPLGNGHTLWTFGDSFTNDYDPVSATTPCLFNVRNACMLQPLNDWDWHHTPTILTPKKTTLFNSDTEPGHFNWPAGGIAVHDTAYIFCFGLKNSKKGMGFEAAGVDALAKMALPGMQLAGYHSLQNFNQISFGLGFVKDETSGYVYVFGTKAIPGLVSAHEYVARFPISNPDAKWEFWDGETWDKDIDKIVPIGETPSNSTNMCCVKGKYLLFTSAFSLGCDAGKNIYVQEGGSPTGPFSKPKVIYTIDDLKDGHNPFFYLPVAHPEYINDRDELLVTYSINGYGNCVPDCVNNRYDPNIYRPRGIRIPLKLIDPLL